MAAPIEGKVAQILSDKLIIINVGLAAGVKVGMRFVVLAQGDEVKDPASGAVLGRWELPKGYLCVTHSQDRLSTCEGAALPTPLGAGEGEQVLSAAMVEASMRPESWGGSGTRLDVNRSQVSGTPRIGPVSVGDTVRQVILEGSADARPGA